MIALHSSLRGTLRRDKLTKAGDASDKSYLAITSNSPVYLYLNLREEK